MGAGVLVGAANDAGGPDNVGCVVADVVEAARPVRRRTGQRLAPVSPGDRGSRGRSGWRG